MLPNRRDFVSYQNNANQTGFVNRHPYFAFWEFGFWICFEVGVLKFGFRKVTCGNFSCVLRVKNWQSGAEPFPIPDNYTISITIITESVAIAFRLETPVITITTFSPVTANSGDLILKFNFSEPNGGIFKLPTSNSISQP